MEDVCEVCGDREFKYKCPKCLKKSCSLACSKKHKVSDDCSGVAHDPSVYVSSEALKNEDDEKHEMNVVVQRDYNFLTQMKRAVELQKRDGKLKNKRMLNMQHAGPKRPRYNENSCQRVIRRGVNCLVLPKGMQRSSMNKSKWDKALDLFVWSIEWTLFPVQGTDSEPFAHVSHRIKETDSIAESMGKIIYDKCCDMYQLQRSATSDEGQETKEDRTKNLVNSRLLFYTKWFPYNTTDVVDSRKLVRLEPSGKSIAEQFRNKTVIEFPTIFVTKQETDIPQKYTIVDERDARETPSTASAASDTSSSEEPPEESIKPSRPSDDAPADDSESDSDGYDPGVTMDFLAN
ncbi:hypothetical protein HG536_0E03350 [Torulaspora globosa]|uniref:HIT-type domain-containing protein n=1 Tax=Torulaspora globosa TaxID=48254 RepID=A0A7G3ZIT8_9SACH|nr:uncharacterized protein HG536_0E03350 [Torulaspora globosa]QLL33424.1 hypothetical protein HG536_0E03350 [Torulaspora globosa]